MAATLDGMVTETGAVYEAKFMLPWSFSEGAAAEKHMAQLQHNMWVSKGECVLFERSIFPPSGESPRAGGKSLTPTANVQFFKGWPLRMDTG
jgi:hypothetical protein